MRTGNDLEVLQREIGQGWQRGGGGWDGLLELWVMGMGIKNKKSVLLSPGDHVSTYARISLGLYQCTMNTKNIKAFIRLIEQ